MKHIKLFENFNKYNLEKDLDKYGIENYTINNDDGTIDVEGNVDLSHENLDKIPFKFGKVTGDFYCNNNHLISLEGCPYCVDGDFSCCNNELTNLKGSPSEVGGSINCNNNDLISLEGMSIEIGGFFNCYGNPNLKELNSMSNIEGEIICDNHVDTSKFLGYCKEIEKYGKSGHRYYDNEISESIDVPGPELYRIAFDEKLKLAKDELEGYLQLFQDLECNCSIRIYSEDKYGKEYKNFDDISSDDFINHIKRTNRSYTLNNVSILLIVSKGILMNTKENKDEVLYLKNLLKDVKKNMKYTSFDVEDLSRYSIGNPDKIVYGKNKNIKRYVLDICFYSKEKSIKENVSISKHLMDNLNKEQLDFIDRFVSRKANYVLNSDKSIDIEGDVYIFRYYASIPTKIPIKFGKVHGNFICNDCGLESLVNMPDYVSGDFECNRNNLKNLIGAPSDVDGNFKCVNNKLESTEGMPVEIGGNFVCYDNNIKEIDSISNIDGALICDKNVDLTNFKGYYKSLHKV